MKESIEHIVLIGAGNMATVLGQAFQQAGLQILQVYNRTLANAALLGQLLSCPYTDQLAQLNQQADLYILCVSDQAIAPLAKELAFLQTHHRFIVHTSGATPGTILQDYSHRSGVFYPLQSLSKNQVTDLKAVPFCVDANTASDVRLLEELANRVSHKVFPINDEQRSLLHVAAVFVNNFSNHLYYLMDQWLQEERIPFELLHPLILEGARKIQSMPPEKAQTGPAIRGDHGTIARHLQILTEKRPELVPIYQYFTESINEVRGQKTEIRRQRAEDRGEI